jgi:hypothetical protein
MDQPPPLQPQQPQFAPPTGRTSGLSIFAFVMALLFFVPLAPIVGLVLGIVALAKAKPNEPRGLAIAAVVVGPLSFLFLQGICAAVAIPAFVKYTRRAKTVEATMNVRRLADAAVAYYAENGKLPPMSDWTPAGKACGQPGNRFAPDPSVWERSPWRELSFSVDTPSYYQYRVTMLGENDAAIEARGDLDCDGEFSLFRRAFGPGGAGSLQTERELE